MMQLHTNSDAFPFNSFRTILEINFRGELIITDRQAMYRFPSITQKKKTFPSPGSRIHSISINGFPKIQLSIWISMVFRCQSLIIHARLDIHIDIQAGIFIQGHSSMDVRISVEHEYPRIDIHVFMDISLQLSMLLLTSIDFNGYPCLDLLRILDPGRFFFYFFPLKQEVKVCQGDLHKHKTLGILTFPNI